MSDRKSANSQSNANDILKYALRAELSGALVFELMAAVGVTLDKQAAGLELVKLMQDNGIFEQYYSLPSHIRHRIDVELSRKPMPLFDQLYLMIQEANLNASTLIDRAVISTVSTEDLKQMREALHPVLKHMTQHNWD